MKISNKTQALVVLIVPRNIHKISQKLFQRLEHDKVSKKKSAVITWSILLPPPQLNKRELLQQTKTTLLDSNPARLQKELCQATEYEHGIHNFSSIQQEIKHNSFSTQIKTKPFNLKT